MANRSTTLIGAAAIVGAACTMLAPQTASAQSLGLEFVVGGISRAVDMAQAPGDFDRLYVAEKRGRIRVIDGGVIQPLSFLDITTRVGTSNQLFDEQGFLGMAFHPDYQNNGFIYVNYTNNAGNTVVERYTATSPLFTPLTGSQIVMTINQPFNNHNGGWMDFGPDGYLYIGTGDGGARDDPFNNSQNTNTLLGNILRIDVDNDDFPSDPNKNYAIPSTNPFASAAGADEIWAYGLRNPWRNDIDPANGNLITADVGQDVIEEINLQFASAPGAGPGDAGYEGGKNYGWRCYEGNNLYITTGGCPGAGTLDFPKQTYNHGVGLSITGGMIYRGCAIPELDGTYFYADFLTQRAWSIKFDGAGNATDFTVRTGEVHPTNGASRVSSFGRDNLGELYVVDHTLGQVWRIVADNTAGFTADDCDMNNEPDACEIAKNPALDANSNGILDVCEDAECPCDWNADGSLNDQDFFDWANDFFTQTGPQGNFDFNGDGNDNDQDWFDFTNCFFNPPAECQ